MNVVHDEVLALVQKEHDAAAEKYGPIASLHEGYAVLLEEVEETGEAFASINNRCKVLWDDIRKNFKDAACWTVTGIYSQAINTACEAIQVAAVCQRILDREDK